MVKIWNSWNQISLVKRIIVGLIIGAILGLLIPGATAIGILGDLFVGALKALAPLLVFFIVMSSLAHQSTGKGTNMKTVILLYLAGTFFAALCAVVASFLFPSTLILAEGVSNAAPSGIGEVLGNLLKSAVSNPVSAIANANYIGVLTWAVVLGLALRSASDATKQVLQNVSDAFSTAIRWVISFAPLGILGLVFTTMAETGISAFASYVHVIVVLVACMFFVALVVNPLMVFLCTRSNPYPLVFKCLKDSGIMAFFTRSSAANIPVNMQLCERLGLNKDVYSISIPLGATINMDGAAITIAVMSLAAANTVGVEVDLATGFVLSVLARKILILRDESLFSCSFNLIADVFSGVFCGAIGVIIVLRSGVKDFIAISVIIADKYQVIGLVEAICFVSAIISVKCSGVAYRTNPQTVIILTIIGMADRINLFAALTALVPVLFRIQRPAFGDSVLVTTAHKRKRRKAQCNAKNNSFHCDSLPNTTICLYLQTVS